jgi:hypothetical protein
VWLAIANPTHARAPSHSPPARPGSRGVGVWADQGGEEAAQEQRQRGKRRRSSGSEVSGAGAAAAGARPSRPCAPHAPRQSIWGCARARARALAPADEPARAPPGPAARVQARGPEGQRRVQASAGAHHRGRLGGACARTGLARVVRSPGISGHRRPPDPSSAPRRARADPGLSTPRGPRAAPVPARLPPY